MLPPPCPSESRQLNYVPESALIVSPSFLTTPEGRLPVTHQLVTPDSQTPTADGGTLTEEERPLGVLVLMRGDRGEMRGKGRKGGGKREEGERV